MTVTPGRLLLIGRPVAHSLSPLFQNAALRQAGIPLVYEALDVAPGDLAATLDDVRRVHGAGNVTIPHKVAVAAACDRLTPMAHRTGAVNTFWHEGDVLVGDNTDVVGFDRLVDSLGLARQPRCVALLGAGGGAAAVCESVAGWQGARVRVWSRDGTRADALARRYAMIAVAVETPQAAASGADLLVNATPIGLHDDAVPLPGAQIPRDAAVTDLVYRAGETCFVREARAYGHTAADGLVMLLEQGAEAFQRWFGVQPDRDVMRRALRQAAG